MRSLKKTAARAKSEPDPEGGRCVFTAEHSHVKLSREAAEKIGVAIVHLTLHLFQDRSRAIVPDILISQFLDECSSLRRA